MQKVITGVLAVATAALSVVCGVLLGELRTAKSQTQAVEQARAAETEAREAQTERVKELERSEARLERQLQDFSKVTTKLRTSESMQSSNLTKMAERLRANGAGKSGGKGDGDMGKGMGDMLGKMMKDPAMRDVLRAQQKAMIDIMYSGLFKDLNLSPEEKDQFKALLTDSQMKNLEAAQGLFGGENKDGGEDAGKLLAEAKKKTDEEVKALLGEERYAKYEDYQKNMGERMQLDSFSKQLAGGEAPLREDQSAKLMQILKEEKAAVPPVIPNDQSEMPKKESFTPENIEKQEQWLKDYNERVAKRAQELLTPEQLKQWVAHQKQQADMAALGMKMASSMFGGKTESTPK